MNNVLGVGDLYVSPRNESYFVELDYDGVCTDCAFRNDTVQCHAAPPCIRENRDDNIDVIYVPVNAVRGTY